MSATADSSLLDALLDAAEIQARTIMLERHQSLEPTWVLINAAGEHRVLGTPWRSKGEKFLARLLMLLELKDYGAVAYSFITEAWLANPPVDWQPQDKLEVPPSRRPDRKECVIALASNRQETRWRTWDIIRDHHEQVIKLEFRALDDQYQPESWLADLLKEI